MMKMKPTEYMIRFDRVNVCPFPQPSTISGRDWRQAAENLAGSLLRQRRVILLGTNVAECFGLKREAYEYLEWSAEPYEHCGVAGFRCSGSRLPFSWAVLSHPSGRNRWYNEEANRLAAAEFLLAET